MNNKQYLKRMDQFIALYEAMLDIIDEMKEANYQYPIDINLMLYFVDCKQKPSIQLTGREKETCLSFRPVDSGSGYYEFGTERKGVRLFYLGDPKPGMEGEDDEDDDNNDNE